MDQSILVKSISFSDAEIIQNILKLHGGGQSLIDVDATYSSGNFYKSGEVEQPVYKYDILPLADDVVKCDCRSLPLDDCSVNIIMFDPPFLATKGKSLSASNKNNIIAKRFGVYPTEKELHQFYVDSMVEFYRVLSKGGILIFKCQDKVSSQKQYFSHVFIMNEAVKIGFYPKDLFILLAKNRLVADWQLRNQQHSRKFHCYYWVFEKSSRVVDYVDIGD